jgi:enterochelin esterase-like enzyme
MYGKSGISGKAYTHSVPTSGNGRTRNASLGIVFVAAGVVFSQTPALQRPFLAADPSDSPRIAKLKISVDSGNRDVALVQFWEEIRKNGTPLIEPIPGEPRYSWVTFLWQAKENTANVVVIDGVASGVGGGDAANSKMTRLAGTDAWYRTYKVRNDAAFTYWVSPNDSLEWLITTEPRSSKAQADPLNPRRIGPQSYVELPAAPAPAWIQASPAAPAGKVELAKLSSSILKNERDVWVYTPPGFQASSGSYPLLVMMDGGAYNSMVPVPAILDNLIAQKRIPPLLAILVGNVDRPGELACSGPFADFLATELVPWMRKNYNATSDPGRTIVGGSSLGGLAAAFAGFQHPEVFGNVLSQSGSNWWKPEQDVEGEWLARQFASAPKRAIRISMSVGLMEVPQQLDTNRHLRDVLTAKGYSVQYAEFNGNHSYLNWRADFGYRLMDLIGAER